MKIEKLTINRKKWFRGRGSDQSALRCRDGRQCCLGFLGSACGFTARDLNDVGLPEATCEPAGHARMWPKGVVELWDGRSMGHLAGWADTQWTSEAVEINDDESIVDAVREELLIQHFAKISIELTFRG